MDPFARGLPGSKVSRRGFPKNRLIEFGIRQQALQPGVLHLQVLQSLGLVRPQTSVLLPLAVIRLLGDTDLLADLRHRLALRQIQFGLPQLREDLLCSNSLPWHLALSLSTPAFAEFITHKTDSVSGGRSA